MFARYVGIGVGHHAQYNLPMSDTGRPTVQNESSIEPDLYHDETKDISEIDEGYIGEGLMDNGEADEGGEGDSDGDDDDGDDNNDESDDEDDCDNDEDDNNAGGGGAFEF